MVDAYGAFILIATDVEFAINYLWNITNPGYGTVMQVNIDCVKQCKVVRRADRPGREHTAVDAKHVQQDVHVDLHNCSLTGFCGVPETIVKATTHSDTTTPLHERIGGVEKVLKLDETCNFPFARINFVSYHDNQTLITRCNRRFNVQQ